MQLVQKWGIHFNSVLYSVVVIFFCHVGFSQNREVEWLYHIQKGRNNQGNYFFQSVSFSVYPAAIFLPATYYTVGSVKKDTLLWQRGTQSVLMLSSAVVLTTLLKYIIHRPRPYDTYSYLIPLQKENTPSFPSGHSSVAFNLATGLSLHYPKWYVVVPAYLYAITVAYSRLYVGAHYPSDALSGAIIGTISAYLVHKVNSHKKQRYSNVMLNYD
ncbi:MAG: phosphatase PAP2 family protein [Bacteroidia bacterium]|nr:phosphatase PAP2 family protein [Bacteroidia bacterium]